MAQEKETMGTAIKPLWRLNGSQLYQDHTLDVLKTLPGESVQCVVTSPPYWGLRDYGLPPVEWWPVRYAPMPGMTPILTPGCVPWCEHEWGEERITTAGRNDLGRKAENFHEYSKEHGPKEANQGQFCLHCGGWRGSLGLEPTIEMYVGHIVQIWRELWRVLRSDGVCWLNLGDSYAQNGGKRATRQELDEDRQRANEKGYWSDAYAGYKGWDRSTGTASAALPAKNLIGIPWRVALALQADGWWLRSDIVWAKGVSFCSEYSGSCMPESVRDRPTRGHEYLFLLSKSKRYFYDVDAVRESCSEDTHSKGPEYHRMNKTAEPGHGIRSNESFERATWGPISQRNLRSVWLINPSPYSGAHFATFPPALVEPCIKAGTSEKGCCPQCGKPWERVIEKYSNIDNDERQKRIEIAQSRNIGRHRASGIQLLSPNIETIDWIPACSCDAGDPVPCTVLDPFAGSGTVGEEAIRRKRKVILIELSEDYCQEHIIPRLEKPIQMELI